MCESCDCVKDGKNEDVAVAETVSAQFIMDVFDTSNFIWCRNDNQHLFNRWNEVENRLENRLYRDNSCHHVGAEIYELFVHLIDFANNRYGACFPKRPNM